MPHSGKHEQQHRQQHRKTQPVIASAMPPSSELPSSYGDSPKRVTPKDITPEHASWKDLKVSDVGAKRSPECEEGKPAAAARGSGSDTSLDEELPSSMGDSPAEMTPKDVGPEHATWGDEVQRKIASPDAVEREEALIDESSELSFPASDPPAELPSTGKSIKEARCEDPEEELLDEAIELTFPASDPIAVTSITRIRTEIHP